MNSITLSEENASGRRAEVAQANIPAAEFFDRLADSPMAVVLAFTVLYLVPTILIAAHKLLWDDEFFTLYLSTTPNWHELVKALSTGADQHPPSFYYLTHLVLKIFGTTHVSLRTPEILGFWLMCILLYFLLRRLLGSMWGVVAMLLPLTSGGLYYYASEARGYGLMLGFSSLALFSWVRATQDSRRRIFVPVLGVSLAASTASHYYAVLTACALCLAELVRDIRSKRIDFPIWIAFGGAAVPPLMFLSVIRSAQGYSGHFWAHPHWRMILTFYPDMLGYLPNVLLGTAAFALIRFALRSRTARGNDTAPPVIPVWIFVAFAAFALIPCGAMVLAKTITQGYVDRYAICGVIGGLILCTFILNRLSQQRTAVARACVALSLVSFAANAYVISYDNALTLEDVKDDRILLTHKTGDGPLAVGEVTIFYRLSFYASPKLARRLAYPADADAAVKYLNQDTVDRGLLELRPWFPMNVVPMSKYLRSHPFFLVYGYIGDWTWVTYALTDPHLETRLIQRRNSRVLFSVENTSALTDAGQSEDGLDRAPSLYSKFENRNQSLCAIYMGANHCPPI